MSSKTIELDYPIQKDGTKISSMEMRRPKVKDTKNADKAASDDAGKELQLFSYLTGQNPEDLEEMDMADYRKLQDAYSDFLA